MTALLKLFRTTAFKLAVSLLAVFTLTAVLSLGYVVWQAEHLIAQQTVQAVDNEVAALSAIYREEGVSGLASEIEARARQPGSLLYLLTAPNGEPIAGNVGALPAGALDRGGSDEVPYARLGGGERAQARARVRVVVLGGGFRMLVGRDLGERNRLVQVLVRAILGGLALVVLLGLAGALLVAWRVLRRLDGMTASSRAIMAGDLAGRLPVTGSGDEFDRLATATNAMLDRIVTLMTELRQVTDNVAHDLKTPLTRLRNVAEEALRSGGADADRRAALERVIEEADALIGTFNAMLLMARAETGAVRQTMAPLDPAEVAEGVAELYEPVAEEAGVPLTVEAAAGLVVQGNRELLGQAVANLVDNALKHGAGEVTIGLARDGSMARLWVGDRGPGIPAEDRAHAIERFVRLERSRSTPGSGLGLSLAQAVARLHGGTLTLEDNAPGLRAVIALPLATEPGIVTMRERKEAPALLPAPAGTDGK
ncbi:MAG TPA: ATP-binding protein [Hyphomicrobiales bacterium]|nr:ATP-binding protein [Hyphomicrobiales bacterium]